MLLIEVLFTLNNVAIMSEYKTGWTGELQEECERRGIDPSGDNDQFNEDVGDARQSGGNGSPNGLDVEQDEVDEEIQFRAPTQHHSNGHVIASSGAG